jgi:hypothetical protein
MKFLTLFCPALAAAGLASAALAADYGDLVTKGYRWVTINGPYAFRAKEDAQKGGTVGKSESEQPDGRAYYLIPGMVVLVVESDSATGLSRIRAGGITADLWTATKNLSTQPIPDTLGIIEAPDNAAIISFTSPRPTPGANSNSANAGSANPTASPPK